MRRSGSIEETLTRACTLYSPHTSPATARASLPPLRQFKTFVSSAMTLHVPCVMLHFDDPPSKSSMKSMPSGVGTPAVPPVAGPPVGEVPPVLVVPPLPVPPPASSAPPPSSPHPATKSETTSASLEEWKDMDARIPRLNCGQQDAMHQRARRF